MTKPFSDTLKAVAWPTYCVAFLLIAIPVLDYVTNVWPLQTGEVRWRYGSIGILAGFLLTPLMGVLFALVAGAVLNHRVLLRILAVVSMVVAGLLLACIGLFTLDALQVRATVPLESRPAFDVGAIKAAVKCFAGAAAFAWIGWAGIRFPRSSERGRTGKGAPDELPLVRSTGAGVHTAPAPSDETNIGS